MSFFNCEALKTQQDVDDACISLHTVLDMYFEPAPGAKKLRNVICELANYHGGFQTFKQKEKPVIEAMHVSIYSSNDGYIVTIGETEFDYDKCFNSDIHQHWKLQEVEERIQDYFDWIAEQPRTSPNRERMINELIFLQDLDDEYYWESTDNASMVAASKDPKRFNEICEEVLEIFNDAQ